MQFESRNPAETATLGGIVAAIAAAGDTIFLNGPLGAGKTEFARAFIRAFTGEADCSVPSPTFSLVQVYEGGSAPVYHFDLYRIKDADEIFELGWEEAQGGGITLVEWAERLGSFAPRDPLAIEFKSGADGRRSISLSGSPAWAARLDSIENKKLA
jgi:tRNA threonylcarbamoyladenosine biosynthesis protein TsaE